MRNVLRLNVFKIWNRKGTGSVRVVWESMKKDQREREQ